MDVLSDMRSYARRNDLHRLSEHLTETLRVAAAELGDSPVVVRREGGADGLQKRT